MKRSREQRFSFSDLLCCGDRYLNLSMLDSVFLTGSPENVP